MTYIKPDPDMQEEQDDLIMSYLNADYLSADTPLSPPSSTSSSSDTTGSPEKHTVDDFMLDINTSDFLVDDHWTTNTNLFNPCFPQQPQLQQHQLQQQQDLSAFPFFLSPPPMVGSQFIQPFLSSSSTGSVSDSEQPKKKRGRKKREQTQPVLAQPSLLAPKPLAPRPNTNTPELIKIEPDLSLTSITTPTTPTKETPSPPMTQEAQKAAQIQKRQERLIKNRAAALLSRKRKREHLTCLEEEKQLLVQENEALTNKVVELSNRVDALEKENAALKQHHHNPNTIINIGSNKRPLINTANKVSSKATGVVFMIMLFSFALFTLPSRTADRLTVGGGSVLEGRRQFPAIGSSHHVDYSVVNNSTDLVLIDAVRPRDLQTWINHKTDVNDIQTWSENEGQRHVYLYSPEFSQIAPTNPTHPISTSTQDLPTLSLISPYNVTENCKDQDQKYLQIDVQVLRSTVIKSQLLPLQQCDFASSLLDGLKKDLITNHQNLAQPQNVTPALIVKRDKRAKKLARVL
ncbi:hypothetical protein INT47_002616 [Mucor saturninus]|uniref:BZIP domain-containing protein n=1 Tax=Mucor saturninus TaxID=64648 RepID=A0A8H7R5V3_9FUNG|nr:hypothetical protein INT47_002616 [Mucor saturninus]